jgi:DNA-binding FadR family transcriptional regulator
VDAIAARDATGAADAMRVHLAHVAEALRRHRGGGNAQRRRAVSF